MQSHKMIQSRTGARVPPQFNTDDQVAHARVRQLGAQQSTVLRAGARQNTLWRYDARVRTQVEFQHCTVNKRVDEKVDSNRLQ